MSNPFRSLKMERLIVNSDDFFQFLYITLIRGYNELGLKGTKNLKVASSIKNKLEAISTPSDNIRTGRSLLSIEPLYLDLNADEIAMLCNCMETLSYPLDFPDIVKHIETFEVLL